MGWKASIFNARESESENLSEEGPDGNYTYDKSGTYGHSDYTVRERGDGTYDVYIESDSEKEHSHDRIDADGNLLDQYHDYLQYLYSIRDNIKGEEEKQMKLIKK